MSDSPRSGATPFCTAKHSALSELELVEAIDQVRVGNSYLTRRRRPEDWLSEELSPRQREILQLYAEGHPMKEIARRLRVSVKAVESHKRRIMDSFRLKSNADVVLFALKQGLIDQVWVGNSYPTRRLRPEDLLSEELSSRQREILQLYAEGHPMKEIAWRLRVSVKAVEFHKRRIMKSFHLKSNADVVLFALKQRLISPRPLDHAFPNAIVNEKNADRRRLRIFPSSQDRI
jgi:DNA-binding NarL/FixJ family response regulator